MSDGSASPDVVTVASPAFVDTPMSASLPLAQPFRIDAQQAAAIIIRGIDGKRAEIVFPWPYRCAVALLGVLPRALADFLLARAGAAVQARHD